MLDWNDLKYLLALFRQGSLKGAARIVGVSDTTVARRLAAMEQALGVTLFVRSHAGQYVATDAAKAMIRHAETVERETLALHDHAGQQAQGVAGVVRISSVPIIVNRVLTRAVRDLLDAHPGVSVELVPASQNLSLSRREADLAVRFARPHGGGLRTKAQKLGEMGFAAYAAAGADADGMAWIGYDETHAHLPQAHWIEKSRPQVRLRVADVETALESAAAGIGKTLLPRMIADADPRLQRLETGKDARLPRREVWMLSHADQAERGSVAAVKAWLTGLNWQ
ncbi:LysR family transcriptional regulator [Pseudaestuariivita atlantica]|nr:LysR family transcriptional regulator [Pseudaestuariivita atlantica]